MTQLSFCAAAFAGGVFLGSYGLKLLCSKSMKCRYVQATAAVLRMKDEVLKDYTAFTESCGDILAEAQEYNREQCHTQADSMSAEPSSDTGTSPDTSADTPS